MSTKRRPDWKMSYPSLLAIFVKKMRSVVKQPPPTKFAASAR